MIRHILSMSLVDETGAESPVSAEVSKSEDNVDEFSEISNCVSTEGGFDIRLKIPDSELVIRGSRNEFIKILKFMEQQTL